ncbi:MAG: N-acetylmuramoyl-L-alanine amidase, partial [Spirochaetaceae bacterium]|nr:N-acetylmuramoyl-L-alanine amidase [Spirochaetaceae bacterium]
MKRKKLLFVLCGFLFYLLCCYCQNINIVDLTQQLNADLYWDTLSGTGVLEKKGHVVQFQTNETLVVADYVLMKITDAPVRKDGSVYVTENFAECVRGFLDSDGGESLFTVGAILIDPGHGGKDSGAVGKHTVDGKKFEIYEKDVVLKVSEELYKKLKKTYPDKKILMTRSDDTFLSLEERVEIANTVPLEAHEAILYVS